MRQLTESMWYYGHQKFHTQFNKRNLDVTSASYSVFDYLPDRIIHCLANISGFYFRQTNHQPRNNKLSVRYFELPDMEYSTDRNNSPRRLSRWTSQAFFSFRVVRYIEKIVRAYMTLSSLVLTLNNFLGLSFAVYLNMWHWVVTTYRDHLTGSQVLINQPILDRDREGHQP